MTQTQTNSSDTIRTRLDSMKTLRDQIRLQLHLAGLDARTEWDKLELRLDHVELESERVVAAALDSVMASVDSIAKSLHEFKLRLEAKTH